MSTKKPIPAFEGRQESLLSDKMPTSFPRSKRLHSKIVQQKYAKITGLASKDPKDKLYALTNDKTNELCYLLAPNAMQLWTLVIETEWFGTGITTEVLRKRGWTARPIRVRVFKRQPKDFCMTCGMATP